MAGSHLHIMSFFHERGAEGYAEASLHLPCCRVRGLGFKKGYGWFLLMAVSTPVIFNFASCRLRHMNVSCVTMQGAHAGEVTSVALVSDSWDLSFTYYSGSCLRGSGFVQPSDQAMRVQSPSRGVASGTT